jgi:hypothetical protein
MNHCLHCGTALPEGELNCRSCGELLAGTRLVAEETLQEGAAIAHGLLKESGLHPILAYIDEGGEPHPINPESDNVPGARFMSNVTTPYAVFVAEDEVDEALRILGEAEGSVDEGESEPPSP